MAANNIVKCICKPGNPNKKCCDSNKYTFKFKDSQQKADEIAPKFISYADAIPAPTFVFPNPTYSFSNVEVGATHLPRPPNIHKHPIYLLNQVFRI